MEGHLTHHVRYCVPITQKSLAFARPHAFVTISHHKNKVCQIQYYAVNLCIWSVWHNCNKHTV